MEGESWLGRAAGGGTGDDDRPRSNDSVPYASHSCLSPLTVWAWRARGGPFPCLRSSVVRTCLSEEEFRNVFPKQTGGRKEEKGSSENFFEGLRPFSPPCLNGADIPPARAF